MTITQNSFLVSTSICSWKIKLLLLHGMRQCVFSSILLTFLKRRLHLPILAQVVQAAAAAQVAVALQRSNLVDSSYPLHISSHFSFTCRLVVPQFIPRVRSDIKFLYISFLVLLAWTRLWSLDSICVLLACMLLLLNSLNCEYSNESVVLGDVDLLEQIYKGWCMIQKKEMPGWKWRHRTDGGWDNVQMSLPRDYR